MRYAGRPVVGFADASDGQRLHAAIHTMMDAVGRFGRSLSPREQQILKVGLEASHAEEAVVAGDFARAQSHIDKIEELLSALR